MVQRKLQRAKRTKAAPPSDTCDESRLHGKYVARDRQGRILVHAATWDALVKAIERRKLKLSEIVIGHIRPRDTILIF